MVSLSIVGLDNCGVDGCRASAVLNEYLDTIDKGGCVNIQKVWHSK